MNRSKTYDRTTIQGLGLVLLIQLFIYSTSSNAREEKV
jgi:hypothetical protein